MVSELAIGDIEQIVSEGGCVSPRDVIRLNALGLKITNSDKCDLATLPRVAVLNGITFAQPTIKHQIFADRCLELCDDASETYYAVMGWILSHGSDELDDVLWRDPKRLNQVVTDWVFADLGDVTIDQIKRVVDYCVWGCDQTTGEYPAYIKDKVEDDDDIGGSRSWALADYLHACTVGIQSEAALRATSPQLSQMIERAYQIHGYPLTDQEKRLTGQYYATLDEIRKNAFEKKDGELNGKQ